jgi:CBS domain-containing protein
MPKEQDLPRRQRRQPPPGEFSDPLKDYSATEYADDMERAIMEGTMSDVQIAPFGTLLPDATVADALQDMAKHDIACLIIANADGKLLGVFTERDVLNKVVGQFEEIKNVPVRALMTPDPRSVRITDSPAKAINIMAVGGFRHVPVVDLEDRVVGVVGPRRMTAYLRSKIDTA